MSTLPLSVPITIGDGGPPGGLDETNDFPNEFPINFGEPGPPPVDVDEPPPTHPYAPYRPPAAPQRGWKIGPLEVPMDFAVGDAAGLAADLRIDNGAVMNMAVSSGDTLAGAVAITAFTSRHTRMLPADGDGGAALTPTMTVTYPNTMDLADGSGGTALAPTLSIVNPPMYGAQSGTSRSDGSNSVSWTHNKPVADNVVLIFTFFRGPDNAALSTYTGRSVTYGGLGLSSIGVTDMGVPQGRSWIELWGIFSPPGGAQTITITSPKAGTYHWIQGVAVSYKGAAGSQAAPGNVFNDNGSLTISSALGHTPVVGFACRNNLSGSFNQTLHANGGNLIVGDAAGAASVTFTSTLPGGGPIGSIGVDLS